MPDAPPNEAPDTALAGAIRDKAHDLGFDAVGIAAADSADPEGHLLHWLARGHHADMGYMAKDPEVRADPRRRMPNARSVIALLASYYAPDRSPEPPLKIARFVGAEDYHRVIRKRLRRLRRFILAARPDAAVYPTVDTSPVLERSWAQRAGIAWVGKSTMAISRQYGTYTFLATLITDIALPPDAIATDHCGSCTRCLDACPTDAFVAPYELDARKCIAYWTVEARDQSVIEVPLHDWVAGCDICQEVCPWNKFARPGGIATLGRPSALELLPQAAWNASGPLDALTPAIDRTTLRRTGAQTLRRNARAILGPDGE